MRSRKERTRLAPGARLRHLLWWIWPAFPVSWAQVPARLRPGAVQITRLTAAAVIAYVAADLLYPGIIDLTAPLTALLVVQASTVGTLRMGLVRVGAVLTGVLVAVGFTSFIRLSWWSLALTIAAALVLARVFRLGEQTLEAPISAMLILAVAVPDSAAEVRLVNTLIGTAVGIGFTLLVPASIPNAQASDSVRRVARSQAALLDEVALTLGDRAPQAEEVAAWAEWTESIETDVNEAAAAVGAAEESRKLNPRALAADRVHPGLRFALDRLEACLVAVRALLVVIADEAPLRSFDEPDPVEADLRRTFAVVLDDVATALRSFGDWVSSRSDGERAEQVDAALARTATVVHETREMLAELMIVGVDPRERTDLWMLHGSVLAAVDHVLRQLDLEGHDREIEPLDPLLDRWRPTVRRWWPQRDDTSQR